MAAIFLSYAREDHRAADKLVRTIKNTLGNVEVFQDRSSTAGADRTIPPGDWLAAIRHELHRCDVVVALVTERYLRSRWLFSEAGGAVLFGKTVLPLCMHPMEPTALPSPLNTQSAYVSSAEGMLDFVRALAALLGTGAVQESGVERLESHDQTDAAREIFHSDSESAIRRISDLLEVREVTGNWLNALHSSYESEAELDAQTSCDEIGHCTIVRRETIWPKVPMFHTFYDVNIDMPGTIKIRVMTDGKPARVLLMRQTDMRMFVATLFEKVVVPGESIANTYMVEAEHLMADLVRTGTSLITYRRHSAVLVRRHVNVLRFPKSNRFRNVRVRVFDSPNAAQRGEVPRLETADAYKFEVDLSSSVPTAGMDEIQIIL